MTVYSKRRALIAGMCITLVTALFLLVKIPQSAPIKSQKKINAKNISAYLKDGDIICRLGDRLWSYYFKDMSPVDKRFSHLGIIRINNNIITVIHAEGRAIQGKDFVNEVDLDEFLEIAKAVGVYRINDYDGKTISSAAMEYTGYPFDWKFDLADENKIYCTELLYVVLQKIAPEIELQRIFQKELKKEIIPLSACSNSDYFTEILFRREGP
jgi:lipopolysaccharide export LptBFGC system permease protein LptF